MRSNGLLIERKMKNDRHLIINSILLISYVGLAVCVCIYKPSCWELWLGASFALIMERVLDIFNKSQKQVSLLKFFAFFLLGIVIVVLYIALDSSICGVIGAFSFQYSMELMCRVRE